MSSDLPDRLRTLFRYTTTAPPPGHARARKQGENTEHRPGWRRATDQKACRADAPAEEHDACPGSTRQQARHASPETGASARYAARRAGRRRSRGKAAPTHTVHPTLESKDGEMECLMPLESERRGARRPGNAPPKGRPTQSSGPVPLPSRGCRKCSRAGPGSMVEPEAEAMSSNVSGLPTCRAAACPGVRRPDVPKGSAANPFAFTATYASPHGGRSGNPLLGEVGPLRNHRAVQTRAPSRLRRFVQVPPGSSV